jgi:hypothetical protein
MPSRVSAVLSLISEHLVNSNQLSGIANAAGGITRLTLNNPRPVGEDDLLAVLQEALNFSPEPE